MLLRFSQLIMRGFHRLQAVSFASSLTTVRLISLGSKAIEGTAPLKSEDQGSRGCGKDASSRDFPNRAYLRLIEMCFAAAGNRICQ